MPKASTIAALLAAAAGLVAHGHDAVAETPPCRAVEYERSAYTICEVDLRKHALRLYWKRSDGTPYAYLSALPRALDGEAGRLLFAINAGMFDPALKPVGLYVEQGRELVHANTKPGYGNFHMKPNGVFYISGDGTAAVAETRGDRRAPASAFRPGQARRSRRATAWACARTAKSCLPFRRERCRSTPSHACSVTG